MLRKGRHTFHWGTCAGCLWANSPWCSSCTALTLWSPSPFGSWAVDCRSRLSKGSFPGANIKCTLARNHWLNSFCYNNTKNYIFPWLGGYTEFIICSVYSVCAKECKRKICLQWSGVLHKRWTQMQWKKPKIHSHKQGTLNLNKKHVCFSRRTRQLPH